MTEKEALQFLQDKVTESIGSINPNTFLDKFIGIKEASSANKELIKTSQENTAKSVSELNSSIQKQLDGIDPEKIVNSILGINPDSENTKNISILNKEFLNEVDQVLTGIKAQNQETLDFLSEANADLNAISNKTAKKINNFENADITNVDISSSANETRSKSAENSQKKSEPYNNSSSNKEQIERLDRIVKILSPDSLRSTFKVNQNFDNYRLRHEQQMDLMRKLLYVNQEKSDDIVRKKKSEDTTNEEYRSTAAKSGGSFLTTFLGGTLTAIFGSKLLGMGRSLLTFGGKVLKLGAVIGLATLAFEAFYPAIQKVVNTVSGWLGFGNILPDRKKNEETGKMETPITGALGLDEPGKTDTIFRSSVGVLMANRAWKMWKGRNDPKQIKDIRNLGRNINVKKSTSIPFSGGAGRNRQAVMEKSSNAAKAIKDKTSSLFRRPASSIPPANTVAENIKAIKAAKAAKEAKLIADAAKLSPNLTSAINTATAAKEVGVVGRALNAVKSFGSGLAGKVAKVSFGTVATGVLGGLLKRIPILSGIYELWKAWERFEEGDYKGMALRLLSASSNLLYLLGPQMVFLQAPLSWWLDYLDESDNNPTTEEPPKENISTPSAAGRSPRRNISKRPEFPKSNVSETRPNVNLSNSNSVESDLDLDMYEGTSFDKTDGSYEETPKRWVSLNPKPPEPPPLDRVIPPVNIIIPENKRSVSVESAPIINNNSSNNSTTNIINGDGVREHRRRARDYRRDYDPNFKY